MIKIFFILLFINNVWAEDVDRIILYETNDPSKLSPKQLNDNKEVLLEKESLLRDENSSLGVYGDYYYTRQDHGRLSLAYHFSHDYERLSKLQVLDFQVMSKVNSYKDQWWGVQLKRVVGDYNAMADELEKTSSHPEANSKTLRQNSQQSMTIIGLGTGYRFKMLEDVFETNRLFEVLMVYGNYIYHLDGATEDKYQGYGLTAEYGIHKRMTKGVFVGGKLGYNIASLERAKASDEDKIDRSLILRWTSLAFEIGYFY